MRDDVRERLTGLGRAAERAAGPVAFERIRLRARRRRRAQALSAVALCVAVAAGVGVSLAQIAGPSRTIGPVHHGSSPHPSPPRIPSPSVPTPAPTHQLAARQIAEDPRSSVLDTTVFPRDTNQAATLWTLGAAGPRAQVALATTVDGYQHVRYVPLPAPDRRDCTSVRALGHDEFWLGCASSAFLVRGDGTVEVARHGRARPRVPDAAVLVSGLSTAIKVGSDWVDAGGLLHAVPVPVSVWLEHAPDGRMWGLTGATNQLYWSIDGGRTWSHRALPRVPAGGTEGYLLVKTAVPGTMVVAHGTESAMFHPDSLLVYGPHGGLQQQVPVKVGLVDSAMVTPDGSLVMELYNEPDGRSGLFRAPAGHWADLHKVMDLPTDAAGRPAAALWMGSSQDTSGRPVVWAVFRSGVLATSTDEGQSWATRSLR